MTNAAQAGVSPPPRHLSVSALAAPLVEQLVANAAALRIGVTQMENGCRVVDAGIVHRGGLEAGRQIAAICMAGLGEVRLRHAPVSARWSWQVEVTTSQPVLACLASQYAGWSLSVDAEHRFHALGSGPGRALARKEPLFEQLGYRDRADQACLVLETERLPPLALAEQVSSDCAVAPERLTLILTPTGSLAGGVQIAARIVEVALHKAHALGFALEHIVDALGVTPLPPPTPNGLAAMGRTNDTILFAGQVHLYVSGPDEAARALADALPSSQSRDYGKPFARVFADYEHDFFRIDPMLFSPAQVAVTAIDSGLSYFAGRVDEALLDRSFSSSA